MRRGNALTLVILLCVGCGGSQGPGPAGDGGSQDLCVAPTGGPTVHDSGRVATDETWTAAASPHDVTLDTFVEAGATLTLEPCAQVRIAGEKAITVFGRIVAAGTPTRRVQIGLKDGVAWSNITTSGGGSLSLKHTTVKGGGNPFTTDPLLTAMLDIRGEQTLPPQPLLDVEDVALEGSASQGILLSEGGGFSTTSSGLRISGSAGAPL